MYVYIGMCVRPIHMYGYELWVYIRRSMIVTAPAARCSVLWTFCNEQSNSFGILFAGMLYVSDYRTHNTTPHTTGAIKKSEITGDGRWWWNSSSSSRSASFSAGESGGLCAATLLVISRFCIFDDSYLFRRHCADRCAQIVQSTTAVMLWGLSSNSIAKLRA